MGRLCGGRAFTLLELILVLAVILALATLSVPAFERLLFGTGVDQAAGELAVQLRLARQQAIASRQRTALLLPGPEMTSHAGAARLADTCPQALGEFVCRASRICTVDRQNQFVAWIEGAEWHYLPSGVAILEADQDNGSAAAAAGALPHDGIITKVDHILLPAGNIPGDLDGDGVLETDPAGAHDDLAHGVRALIFKPDGRLASAQRIITLGEAVHDGRQWVVIRNRKNLRDLYVDQYHGRLYPRP